MYHAYFLYLTLKNEEVQNAIPIFFKRGDINSPNFLVSFISFPFSYQNDQ